MATEFAIRCHMCIRSVQWRSLLQKVALQAEIFLDTGRTLDKVTLLDRKGSELV